MPALAAVPRRPLGKVLTRPFWDRPRPGDHFGGRDRTPEVVSGTVAFVSEPQRGHHRCLALNRHSPARKPTTKNTTAVPSIGAPYRVTFDVDWTTMHAGRGRPLPARGGTHEGDAKVGRGGSSGGVRVTTDRSPTGMPAHVLERADMRDALTRHDFGQVFALAKKWAGFSYSKIGAACGIKPERVGALARGAGVITSYEKIARIADALLIPGHMVGLAPRVWESVPPEAGRPWIYVDVGRDGDGGVFRRDLLKASAAVGAGFAVGPGPEDGRRRIGSELPGVLRQRAARLRRLDNVLGGGDTFHIYMGEYHATKALLRDGVSSDATRAELLSVLAEQAQQAGWAAFDAGNHAEAVRLYGASRTAAEQGEDRLLVSNAFAFLAYQRIPADPAAAVQLATGSCEVAGAAAIGSAGALLHERRAWAHAVSGNAGETARALEDAQEALAAGGSEPGPDWSAWVDGSELRIMAGRCWTELRRPLRAVPILKTVLADFDDAYARDKALYLSWLADAYLGAGEVEESAATVSRALDLSAGVASVRPRQQLSRVLDGLGEYRSVSEVAQVFEKIRA